FKLKFGHRGANQPVKDLRSGKVAITAQNHGFAVDPESLPKNVEVSHINLNDNTVEGMRHKELPIFSVQYHPEAAPGPHDASYFFSQFADLIESARERRFTDAPWRLKSIASTWVSVIVAAVSDRRIIEIVRVAKSTRANRNLVNGNVAFIFPSPAE